LKNSLKAFLCIYISCLFSRAADFDPALATNTEDRYGSRFSSAQVTYAGDPYGQGSRQVRVIVPKDYATSTARYAVAYIFDASLVGNARYFDMVEVADYLAEKGLIEPLILVGWAAYNRTDELGGGGRMYTDNHIANEIVPYIDSHFRTIQSTAARCIGGFSLGGISALRIGWAYTNVFGRVLACSPSYDAYSMYNQMAGDSSNRKNFMRVFMEAGAQDYNYTSENGIRAYTARMARALKLAGWSFGDNLAYLASGNYAQDLIEHSYVRSGNAARSGLYFLFRINPLEMSSAHIVPYNIYEYLGGYNYFGRPLYADRIDLQHTRDAVKLVPT
jgi:predicted alpha/beta superfamily hydrolase